jgi:hypothetical protein
MMGGGGGSIAGPEIGLSAAVDNQDIGCIVWTLF